MFGSYKMLKNILIYNSGGGLGDSIQLIPLILSLKNHFKESEFSVKIFLWWPHVSLRAAAKRTFAPVSSDRRGVVGYIGGDGRCGNYSSWRKCPESPRRG